MKKLLSGVKPTGRPHLGNYFGAMKQFVDLQDSHESYIFIADLHALTSVQDGFLMKKLIVEVMLDYLAIGLDPKKTTVFKQSDVPEVAELAWIFDCITTVPYLMRAHAYKSAEANNKEINVGVFNYPILMAADILLPEAEIVPVGKDQKQHIEYARDTAQKFNRVFGETFKMPEALILKEVQTVPGFDGKKMSKSYKNTISLFASEDEIRDAVMKIPTDSLAIDEPKNPDENIIYQIHSLVLTKEEILGLRKKFEAGGLSYKEAKENLITDLNNYIAPLRKRRDELAKNIDEALEILKDGGEKMRKQIQPKINEVRLKTGIKLY